MNVICYGDSNTYGYDPRSYMGCRYSSDFRWVDILSAKSGWNVANYGINGREIPCKEVIISDSPDLFVVMLGTNDLLQGYSVGEITDRMEAFLDRLKIEKRKLFLVAPPHLTFGQWVSDINLIGASIQLSKSYQSLASRLGIRFADAGEWNITLAFDGVHFTEDGHRVFAEKIYQNLLQGFSEDQTGGVY